MCAAVLSPQQGRNSVADVLMGRSARDLQLTVSLARLGDFLVWMTQCGAENTHTHTHRGEGWWWERW